MNEKPYVIIRGKDSGVFAGYLESRKGSEVVLSQVRWIWYWDGAASIAQLAKEGTSKPNSCKFPPVFESVEVLDVIQIIPCTETARLSIEAVPEWRA